MVEITKQAKTVDEAINKALQELQLTKEQVDITILDEGNKGFLGLFGSKEAVVTVKEKFNAGKACKLFLTEVFSAMKLEVKIEMKEKDSQIFCNFTGDKMGILIGKHGQTLDSLQLLVNLSVNKYTESYIGIYLDTENYRQRRKETLSSLAYNLGKKVKSTKKKVVLEPMPAHERRVIHNSLQKDAKLKTSSEGNEPHRYVVIDYINQ